MYSTTWNPKTAIYIACKIPILLKNDQTAIRNQWERECIFNSFASNQRGVALLLSNNFEYKILNTKTKDDCGNLLGVDIEIEGKKNNIYGPNNDTPLFYNKVGETIEYVNNQSIILTGDYNLVQNQRLDTYNYVGINNPKAKDKVLDMIEIYNLTDPFRELYPDLKRYTWRKRTPLKQARLDFFLISQSFNHQVHDVKIINSYRSDHCPIILQLKLSDFILGMGLWKFNHSLFYIMDYVETLKETIKKN